MTSALKQFSLFMFFSIFLLFQNTTLSQQIEFAKTELIRQGNKSLFVTHPEKYNSLTEIPVVNSKNNTRSGADRFVLGGNVIWTAQDALAIANAAELNADGSMPFNAWGLNNMRLSRYNSSNNIPVWEVPTVPNDPGIDVSDDGEVIAVTKGTEFLILDSLNGNVKYQMIMPDTLWASHVSVSRSGEHLVFLADASGNGTTAIAYAISLAGSSPAIIWSKEISRSVISNWAGANFSADGNTVVINGRNHQYVYNVSDGSLIWDHFIDNTESPAVISGDGSIIVTADNSGFIQTWIKNQSGTEYNLLWQYKIPLVSSFTNWASSVDISADGSTIVAGTLIFLSSGYDGSVIAFDTYGGGIPKWTYLGAADLVDDIALSDDGKVAAAVTWGDLSHIKPDLLVFDVETGDLTFEIVSPGSFFTVDISHDGKKIIAGGKGVHAREFGNGGRLYYSEINLGGGNVSGTVDLAGTSDDSGVLLKVSGNPRAAVSDQNGNFLITNIPAGTYTITAEKPGYNYGSAASVNIVNDSTTTGVNFSLAQFNVNPPTLSASTNLQGAVVLSWTTLTQSLEKQIEIAKAVGDPFPVESVNKITNAKNSSGNFSNKDFPISHETLLADSITIYRSLVQGGPYSKISSVSTSNNNYSDSSVFPLRDYYYVINVTNETGQSIYSNEVLGRLSDSLLTFDFDAPLGSVPVIDGVISPGEWTDAFKIDVSDVLGYSGGSPKPQGSVFMYFKYNDQNDMLYIAGEDFLNNELDDSEGFGLYFDDNNNDAFEPNGALPLLQEGNFWAYWHAGGSDLRFRKIFTGGGVGDIITLTEGDVEFTITNGHLQGEVAIPMGFFEGYQLQIFAPDKTPGLGAFLIERNAGAAIFNGWWPQTMNSVFNPLYFGNVGVDVSLLAPPQAPDSITVTIQGENLLVTWADPVLGLNNDPLTGVPTIDIYRNGKFFKTIAGGTEMLLDDSVDCQLWYEYKMIAYIILGDDTLFSPVSRTVGGFACEEPALTPVKYDDGSWEAFYVVDFTYDENKFALKVTPTFYPAKIIRLETLVNNAGAFDFTLNKDESGLPGDIIAGPYRVSSGIAGAANSILLTLPGIDPPTIEAGEIWVLINYLETNPGDPGIGTDASSPNSGRGMYYLSSSGWQSFTGGNLMVTTYIAQPPTGINENANKLLTFGLSQNYPNPFNPSSLIKFQMPETEFVNLEIFNVLGEKINTLVNDSREAGEYSVIWDGTNYGGIPVSSGVYFYKITAGKFTAVRKMILIK
ncbi:MAG: T9SS type A sorting domain-containing protein [Ignavibacteriales bacterium]|nr:MAG: T9SS type A sorting domain-containing protein [Ignavibacteriales bacterium]